MSGKKKEKWNVSCVSSKNTYQLIEYSVKGCEYRVKKRDSTHKRKFATNARKFLLSCVSLCSFWSAFVPIQSNNNDVMMHSYAMSNEYMFIDKCFKIWIFSTIFFQHSHILYTLVTGTCIRMNAIHCLCCVSRFKFSIIKNGINSHLHKCFTSNKLVCRELK